MVFAKVTVIVPVALLPPPFSHRPNSYSLPSERTADPDPMLLNVGLPPLKVIDVMLSPVLEFVNANTR